MTLARSIIWKNNGSLKLAYSYIRGQDISNDLPLINIPSNNLLGKLTYDIGNFDKVQELTAEMSGRYVFQQHRIQEEQDFLLPPDSYYLMDFSLAGTLVMEHARLRLTLRGENILNTVYRDYLNRQRYFADAEGINLVAGAILEF